MNRKSVVAIGASIAVILTSFMYSCGAGSSSQLEITGKSKDAAAPQNDTPYLKVFIENSGSMDGYMCDGSQLKDAVYDYVSDLNRFTRSTDFYYINSQIIPYKGNLKSYIKDLTPASFQAAGGNRSSSDMGSLISAVLKTVNDSTVSIFISDCILDLPAKDAQKFLTSCEIEIKDEIINARKRIPNLGVEILMLSSDFEGKYYYPNGAVEALSGVKRPYYMWIFGDKNNLAKLNSNVPLSQLEKYGLSGVVAFTNISEVPYEVKNTSGTGSTVLSGNGAYHFNILADMTTTLQPSEAIQNVVNYAFNNQNIKVEKVVKITAEGSNYTHVITAKIPNSVKVAQERLSFKTPELPGWVAESNDESGTNVRGNLTKTTGIKYLIEGVADAYKGDKTCAEFNINVKRK